MKMSFAMDAEAEADALTAKIITMVCLFGISMITGCLPLLISLKWDWFKTGDANLRNSNQLVMGLLAFGGGILFATTFMHLLPEVDENIEHLQGFFMIYLIEELVHLYINSRENKKRNNSFAKPFKMRKSSLTSGRSIEAATTAAELSQIEANGKKEEQNHLPLQDHDSVAGALRGLLIVLALSIHELFEGLAVGLESSVANVWYMFAAVSAHKYIIAFCIGVELLASGTKKWLSIVYIFTFSFMSALGIGVGILLVGGAGAADAGVYSVVLQGLACGTLVYVVFFEVWKGCNGLMQFSCALFGFAVMVGLELIVELVM
ncbi:hypothetical protein HW555_009840 [Spodoptera exigua]|uniref:Uncharacterized protein n=2 Tax=Spodoptera exigua TaxID=7107 RepID=A0A835GAH4_SPOEX|nr:hypothetical protein HW555_009840 [Spodoptera exigua]